jgi:hypothetical protein
MSQRLVKVSLLAMLVMVVGLCAVWAQSSAAASQTITGCLQKGNESGGYYLVGADCHHWELYPAKGIDLSAQVGHTVALTGSVTKRTAAQEEKSQPAEKKEITGKAHADFEVTGMKHISDSCKK